MRNRHLYYLTTFTFIIALFVIALGAFTRLTDAGLGCPDWPGCYGKMIVSHDSSSLTPLHQYKAWTEMIHRYAAGSLSLFIFITTTLCLLQRRKYSISWIFPVALLGLLLFQAALGMWTVTLKLHPLVVLGHLLGGFSILTLLWCLRLHLNPHFHYLSLPHTSYRYFALLGLILLILQITLGAWVSSNYAGLVCTGFPTCNGTFFPEMNFKEAFNFLSPLGSNYQGGLLDSPARAAIQMTHRLGAVITASYLILLSLWTFCRAISPCLRNTAVLIFLLVITQFILGILNITQLLALPIALGHNIVAAFLLLAVSTLVYGAICRGEKIS